MRELVRKHNFFTINKFCKFVMAKENGETLPTT
jgi:hypothetical protein